MNQNTTEETKTEDMRWGVQFCYCSQHVMIHATGWCTVGAHEKIPLHGSSIEEAKEEFKRIKLLVAGK